MNDRRLTIVGVLTFFLLTAQLLHLSQNYKWLDTAFYQVEHVVYGSVMNATLGFNSIQQIMLPNTTKYEFNQRVMSLATGLVRTQIDAPVQGNDAGGDLELSTRLWPHIKLWQDIVDQGIQAMLILESDAIWDENIKPVQLRLAKALNELLSMNPTEDDPYSSQHWDVVSFGSCGDSEMFLDTSVTYDDPEAPEEDTYFGHHLKRQRIVRRMGYFSCTTGYAISQRGAQRMLMRSALGLGANLDFIMGEMSATGKLDVFSVYPPTFTINKK